MPARPGRERQQQARPLEATHRVRFAGVKRDQCAVVAGGRVLADRNADASVQHLDEDAVAVPRITDLLVGCEVDHVNTQTGGRKQLVWSSPFVLVSCVEVPRLHG